MKDRQMLIRECRKLIEEGADREKVVSYLRNEGCLKIDSIVIIREALAISLGDAKGLVHCSATWRDVRERDDEFHDKLIDAVTPKFR